MTRRIAILALPAGLLLLAVYVWPMLGLGRMAFNETTDTGAELGPVCGDDAAFVFGAVSSFNLESVNQLEFVRVLRSPLVEAIRDPGGLIVPTTGIEPRPEDLEFFGPPPPPAVLVGSSAAPTPEPGGD